MHVHRTGILSSNSTDGCLHWQRAPERACAPSREVSLPTSDEVGRRTSINVSSFQRQTSPGARRRCRSDIWPGTTKDSLLVPLSSQRFLRCLDFELSCRHGSSQFCPFHPFPPRELSWAAEEERERDEHCARGSLSFIRFKRG